MRCTLDQGFEEPKIPGLGWEYARDHVWNQQDGVVTVDNMPRFSGGAAGYEQSHDVL